MWQLLHSEPLRRLSLAGFAMAVALLGCTADGGRVQPTISFEPHVFADENGNEIEGELGRLLVAGFEAEPPARIELAVARFKSTSDSPGPPIVYLAGGPGSAGINSERMPLYQALRAFGDVITFDQRGTGASEPALTCGDPLELPADRPLGRAELLDLHREHIRDCAESLRDGGIDLSLFNTLASVDDVGAIRRALGVEQIRIVGPPIAGSWPERGPRE